MNDKSEFEAAVIERLDALIVAVNRLADGIQQKGPRASHDAVERAPVDAVVERSVSPQRDGESVPALSTAADAAADTMSVTIDEELVSDVPGPNAPFEVLIARMFEAVQRPEQERAWLEMTALTHPKELVAPRALDSLKAFSWKQLRKNAPAYLSNESMASFTVVRTDPADLTGDLERVKVFLSARGRSPAPITLKRDAAAGGAWRLGQVSL